MECYKQAFNLCSDAESKQDVILQLDDIKEVATELWLNWTPVPEVWNWITFLYLYFFCLQWTI